MVLYGKDGVDFICEENGGVDKYCEYHQDKHMETYVGNFDCELLMYHSKQEKWFITTVSGEEKVIDLEDVIRVTPL